MEHLIQHFRHDEQPFIEQVLGWQREIEDRYTPKLTDFLDPRQQFIVEAIIRQHEDIKIAMDGTFEQPERQRMLLYPSYYEVQDDDFQIEVLTIQYPTKFVTLKHPDVLGALLSIGLERSKFGDIRVDDGKVQFAVAAEVADYVRLHLNGIGKVKVYAQTIEPTEPLILLTEEWQEHAHTVSSMRLDVVLATVFNISRQKSQALINGSKVRVNWTVREQVAFELQEGDIISARGYGRAKLLATEGRTKKDKIRLIIGRLEQKV